MDYSGFRRSDNLEPSAPGDVTLDPQQVANMDIGQLVRALAEPPPPQPTLPFAPMPQSPLAKQLGIRDLYRLIGGR